MAFIIALAIVATGLFLEARLAPDSHFIQIYWKQAYRPPSDR